MKRRQALQLAGLSALGLCSRPPRIRRRETLFAAAEP